jgi:hypothetical protein
MVEVVGVLDMVLDLVMEIGVRVGRGVVLEVVRGRVAEEEGGSGGDELRVWSDEKDEGDEGGRGAGDEEEEDEDGDEEEDVDGEEDVGGVEGNEPVGDFDPKNSSTDESRDELCDSMSICRAAPVSSLLFFATRLR